MRKWHCGPDAHADHCGDTVSRWKVAIGLRGQLGPPCDKQHRDGLRFPPLATYASIAELAPEWSRHDRPPAGLDYSAFGPCAIASTGLGTGIRHNGADHSPLVHVLLALGFMSGGVLHTTCDEIATLFGTHFVASGHSQCRSASTPRIRRYPAPLFRIAVRGGGGSGVCCTGTDVAQPLPHKPRRPCHVQAESDKHGHTHTIMHTLATCRHSHTHAAIAQIHINMTTSHRSSNKHTQACMHAPSQIYTSLKVPM
jgi:hypothetical protein